jgi:hypothetical protein
MPRGGVVILLAELHADRPQGLEDMAMKRGLEWMPSKWVTLEFDTENDAEEFKRMLRDKKNGGMVAAYYDAFPDTLNIFNVRVVEDR